jgi:hypothetical protein
VGAELHVRLTIGYNYDIDGFCGYARGFDESGEKKFYFGLSTFLSDMFNHADKRIDYL